jgi:hypothetical protein
MSNDTRGSDNVGSGPDATWRRLLTGPGLRVLLDYGTPGVPPAAVAGPARPDPGSGVLASRGAAGRAWTNDPPPS